MSFALGLLIGFCLGVLCMALLYVAKGAGLPSAHSVDTPTPELGASHHILSPEDPPTYPLVKD